MTLRLIQKVSLQPSRHQALDSSVGRAGDCRGIVQTSLGHWFESGSRDIFFDYVVSLCAIGKNQIHEILNVLFFLLFSCILLKN